MSLVPTPNLAASRRKPKFFKHWLHRMGLSISICPEALRQLKNRNPSANGKIAIGGAGSADCRFCSPRLFSGGGGFRRVFYRRVEASTTFSFRPIFLRHHSAAQRPRDPQRIRFQAPGPGVLARPPIAAILFDRLGFSSRSLARHLRANLSAHRLALDRWLAQTLRVCDSCLSPHIPSHYTPSRRAVPPPLL